jgi:hypothetical protein
MQPGIYRDLSNEDYHKDEGLSASMLKLLAQSPAHLKFHQREETEAMAIGTAVHTAVFEPERFEAEYVVAPKLDRRTKAGKDAWAEFEAAMSGKKILAENIYDKVTGMAASVKRHPIAGPLTQDGEAEVSVYWNAGIVCDRIPYEVLCKARPDYLKEADGKVNIIDLKTCEDARLEFFMRNAWNYGYHIQAAHFINGCNSALENPVGLFAFIAVEKKPPYALIVHVAGTDFLAIGRETVRRLLPVWHQCLKTDWWPAYEETISVLDVPAWAR